MNRRSTTLVGAVAATVLAASAFAIQAGPAGATGEAGRDGDRAPRAVGLTADGELVTFRVDRPRDSRDRGAVTGLTGDTELVGIDYRVQDGRLYGVGNAGGVYTINVRKAVATMVSQLTVPLTGAYFGVDFNPAADALRIVSDTGQNLRHVVNPGGVTVQDTALNVPPSTAPVAGVVGAAYTNNDLDTATGTTLLVLNHALDSISTQVPANAGTLTLTGAFRRDTGPEVGFDIYSELKRGRTSQVQGFAALSTGGRHVLYRVALLPGELERVGPFTEDVVDLAVGLDD